LRGRPVVHGLGAGRPARPRRGRRAPASARRPGPGLGPAAARAGPCARSARPAARPRDPPAGAAETVLGPAPPISPRLAPRRPARSPRRRLKPLLAMETAGRPPPRGNHVQEEPMPSYYLSEDLSRFG